MSDFNRHNGFQDHAVITVSVCWLIIGFSVLSLMSVTKPQKRTDKKGVKICMGRGQSAKSMGAITHDTERPQMDSLGLEPRTFRL